MRTCCVFAMIITSILFNSCDNNDSTDCTGIDCLPPITQTGAGTFGCLVNGEPFFSFGEVNCKYQLINGSYEFIVGFDRMSGFPIDMSILSNRQSISESTFQFTNCDVNNSYCANVVFVSNLQEIIFNDTDNQNSGSVTFNNFDETNQIVSGTFEFEILNPADNQIYQITEGRFDSFYAR